MKMAKISVCFLALCVLSCEEGPRVRTGPASGENPSAASSTGPSLLPRTLYGFFPSPPELTLESLIATYKAIAEHGDQVLLQRNVPWEEFLPGPDGPKREIQDIAAQRELATGEGLGIAFVVDPLNGLNRREFSGLPPGWKASFADPRIRAAYRHFALRIAREYKPRFLGLASEINTYADSHPEDFPAFLSLYRETYDLIKDASPETQVFVTFQWEEINNLIPGLARGKAMEPNWDQFAAFEPRLDLWAISSYPFAAFRDMEAVPADYYARILGRTAKPIAVAEGGYNSKPIGPVAGSERGQIDYLAAIHGQLGGARLAFWVYLLLSDLRAGTYEGVLEAEGRMEDAETLGMFAYVGLRDSYGGPKPALEAWDGFRE